MHRKPPPKSKSIVSKPTFLLLTMASLLLLSMASLLLLFHSPFPLSSSQQTPPPPPPSQSAIAQACKSSLFPSLCISTLLSQPPSSSLLLSLLSASSHSLSTALSLSRSLLLSSSSTPSRANAARNCLDHLTLSSLRINSTLPLLPPTDQQTAARARALTSAALLYQYDCWSALKYVNSTRQVAAAMSFLHSLTQITSSALSMIAAAQRYGPDDPSLWSPPQTERDGYWPPHADSADDVDVRFPSDLKPDATVCKASAAAAGSCDYATVQEAVDAAPDFGPGRFAIHIKSGTYAENVVVAFQKTNVVFVGDGMGKTVVTGSLNAQMPAVTTYNTATVGVFGDGFMARDLTFENTAGPGSHQAVAFRCDGDRSLLYSVEFLGHQDTLYARSLRQLYVNCTVSGTVDFIFGNSAAVFRNCLIQVLPRQESPEKGESNAVTAHGRTDPGQATGFVFKECTVNGSDEYVEIYRRRPTRHRVYLGRPWKEYSRTVFLNCYLGEMVRPEGWMPFRPGFGLKTLFYGEYGSSGPGANVSGRVGWSSQVPEEHLGMYSVRNFLQGDEWALKNQ